MEKNTRPTYPVTGPTHTRHYSHRVSTSASIPVSFSVITNENNRRSFINRRTRSQTVLISGVTLIRLFYRAAACLGFAAPTASSSPRLHTSVTGLPRLYSASDPLSNIGSQEPFVPPTGLGRVHIYPLFLWCPNHSVNYMTPRLDPPRYQLTNGRITLSPSNDATSLRFALRLPGTPFSNYSSTLLNAHNKRILYILARAAILHSPALIPPPLILVVIFRFADALVFRMFST